MQLNIEERHEIVVFLIDKKRYQTGAHRIGQIISQRCESQINRAADDD